MRKRWLLILLVLLLAAPLVLLLRGYAREVVLTRLLYIGWWLRLLFESQPEVRIWTALLVVALLVALRSMLRRHLPQRPARAAKVGRMSMVVTISSLTRPGGILPGQRAMHGTRGPPSHDFILEPRSG